MALVQCVDDVANRRRIKRILRAVPILAALIVLLAALYLVSDVEQESSQLGQLNLVVLLCTGIALLVLAAVIIGRLYSLVRSLRANRPGARLTARLVAVFTALALPPVVIVYLFSVEFLSETIDGWFDVETESALADSIELGQLFMQVRTREVSDQLARLAETLPRGDEDRQFRALIRRVSSAGPTELSLLDEAGRSLVFAHIDSGVLNHDAPSNFALTQALENQVYAAAEPAAGGRLRIRVLRALPPGMPGEPGRVLQGLYPLPENFSDLAEAIEAAYFRYENVAYLRERLRQSFVLILSLVLLLTGLLAMLLAFNAARRLVAPVRDLAEATEEMTAGRFPRELAVPARDELGFLVRSFNTMTRQLAHSQQQLESQRAYLETLLSRLSSGVLAIDGGGRLNAWNTSAGQILALDLAVYEQRPLSALAQARPDIAPLVAEIGKRMTGPARDWRQEIKLGTREAPLVLVCRGSTLPAEDPAGPGHVVVFDDVTVLDQAQREAAWAEVARRLAHEVKNPLTPIRLAAERLKFKLSGGLDEERRSLLDKATQTIVSQVDALKRLVDAFGDYAHTPALELETVDVEAVIREVVDLYTSGDMAVKFELDLSAATRGIQGDPDRIRQVLHNLIRNAQEAHPDGRPRIRIATGISEGDGSRWLELVLEDDGPGIPEAMMERLFEPYVTSKTRGTGLGLAITRRIVDEHGGQIRAENSATGARVTILFPLREVLAETG